MLSRRTFIHCTATLSLGYPLTSNASTTAISDNTLKKNKKVIWIILRGAMDALHAVVPHHDKYLATHRRILFEAINDDLLALDSDFALHPKLSFCHSLFKVNEFAPVVAVASPYRARSHFDAQDILENGQKRIDHSKGWLTKVLEQYSGEGIAIAQNVPMSLRGSPRSRTWYPSRLPEAHDDLYQRLQTLYDGDQNLRRSLDEILETNARLGGMASRGDRKFVQLAQACGKLLNTDPKANCATLELGGWDTHNNLVPRLDRQFSQLDAGISALRTELAELWQDTLVIIGSEFGRTVKVNGTRGSDHGTGTVLLFAGGALNRESSDKVVGGRVHGEWPGLDPKFLYENRDLYPTGDLFSWISSAIHQHWSIPSEELRQIFPDSPV